MSFLNEHNVDLTNVKVEHADFVLNSFLKFALHNLILVASNNRYKSIFLQMLELQIVGKIDISWKICTFISCQKPSALSLHTDFICHSSYQILFHHEGKSLMHHSFYATEKPR